MAVGKYVIYIYRERVYFTSLWQHAKRDIRTLALNVEYDWPAQFVQANLKRYFVSCNFSVYRKSILTREKGLSDICVKCRIESAWAALVTTRPIPYLHQTSIVLRKSPLELLCVSLK